MNNIVLFNKENMERQMFSTVDGSTKENKAKLFNATENADVLANDCVGEEFTLVDAYVERIPSIDEETGEQITRKKHALILFDENNRSYATGSNACYMSYSNIVSIKGLPTRERPLKLDIIESPAEEKGHSYLKVKLHVDKED